jgi:cytoskeletal protein CcmA (bactofilin family)
MWKRREDEKPFTPPARQQPFAAQVPAPTPNVRPVENTRMDNFRNDVAHIGKSVVVKGELSGSEDLYLDGEVEGSIELKGNALTIGPNGRVRANIHARDVVVHGKVEGNIRGTERVELRKSALLHGDIFTQRIVIEDGAFFKGSIDIQKAEAKPEPKAEVKAAAVAVGTAAPVASSAPAASGSTAPMFTPQPSLLDKK